MANQANISQYGENNLRKLAVYLLSNKLVCGFDMRYFCSQGETDCDTAACAAGHGPYAGMYKNMVESWTGYVERVFNMHGESDAYLWCFASGWVDTDNTPQGAAKRILYMLEHGVPLNYFQQMRGLMALCYNN